MSFFKHFKFKKYLIIYKVYVFKSNYTQGFITMSNILLERAEVLIDAPILCLSESVAQTQLSEGLMYHIQNKLPLYDNIYRVHSQAYYDLYSEARQLSESGKIILGQMDSQMLSETDIGNWGFYEGQKVPLDSPIMTEDEEWSYSSPLLREAEYQGKKVKLNSPQRGGNKKFYVYTKNDKGNVVKVSFGQPGAKIAKSAAARKSFLARHKCDSPGPKWKANYWACNIGRYKKQLGLKFPGRW